MQWIYLTKWENPTATLSPKGTHTGSEPVCPERGSTGYAVAPLHLLTGMSQHREEMKTRVCPDPIPALVVLPEPALTDSSPGPAESDGSATANKPNETQTHATLANCFTKGITG